MPLTLYNTLTLRPRLILQSLKISLPLRTATNWTVGSSTIERLLSHPLLRAALSASVPLRVPMPDLVAVMAMEIG